MCHYRFSLMSRILPSLWKLIKSLSTRQSCTKNLCLLFLWPLASPGGEILPKKRARLTEVPEDEESPSPSPLSARSSPSPRSLAKQRNRRRCHFCRTKLELVQQEMGSCRCGTLMQLYSNINMRGRFRLLRTTSRATQARSLFLRAGSVPGWISDQSAFANLEVIAEEQNVSHYA